MDWEGGGNEQIQLQVLITSSSNDQLGGKVHGENVLKTQLIPVLSFCPKIFR